MEEPSKPIIRFRETSAKRRPTPKTEALGFTRKYGDPAVRRHPVSQNRIRGANACSADIKPRGLGCNRANSMGQGV